MKIELAPAEARVIGSLLEKQVTTPDQYPLSLHALSTACNQKSNRDPLFSLGDAEVQTVVDGLVRKSLVMEKSGFGSRVPKYQQRFCNLEFSALRFTPLELAIVCELLLRGPQSSGELRTRAARMAPVRNVAEVEAALGALAGRTPHPLVQQLPRASGQRDVRWTELFTAREAGAEALLVSSAAPSSAAAAAVSTVASAPVAGHDDRADRLARLEAEVHQLRLELEALRQAMSADRAD